MACTCVVGLQWGDEAKGKIVDLLTEQHDLVVRYNGGANAGHTVVADGQHLQAFAAPDRRPATASAFRDRQRRRRPSAALPRRSQCPPRRGHCRRQQSGAQRPCPRHFPLPPGGRTPERTGSRPRDRHHRPRHRALLPGQGGPGVWRARRRAAASGASARAFARHRRLARTAG